MHLKEARSAFEQPLIYESKLQSRRVGTLQDASAMWKIHALPRSVKELRRSQKRFALRGTSPKKN
jgi:hypothetical protein